MSSFNKKKYNYKDNVNSKESIFRNTATKALNINNPYNTTFLENRNLNSQNKEIKIISKNSIQNYDDNNTFKIDLNKNSFNMDLPRENPYKYYNNIKKLKDSIDNQFDLYQDNLDKKVNEAINDDIKSSANSIIDLLTPVHSNNKNKYNYNFNKPFEEAKNNCNINKKNIQDSSNDIEDDDNNSSNDSINTVDLLFKKDNNKEKKTYEVLDTNESFMQNLIINEYNDLIKKKKDKLILYNDEDDDKKNYSIFKNTCEILSQKNVKIKIKNRLYQSNNFENHKFK